MKKLIALVLLGIVSIGNGHNAVAAEARIYSGNFCQDVFSADSGVNIRYTFGGGAYNPSSSYVYMACPVFRVKPLNSKLREVWITGYRDKIGSATDFWCQVGSTDHHGRLIHDANDYKAYFGTNKGRVVLHMTDIPTRPHSTGHIDIQCRVPQGGKIVEYEVEE